MIWATLINNPVARGAAAVGFFLIMFLLWLARHDREIERRRDARNEKIARKRQDKIRIENDEKLEKAERTRADFRADDADDDYVLSNAAIRRITRRSD